jgi:hypothetical protein
MKEQVNSENDYLDTLRSDTSQTGTRTGMNILWNAAQHSQQFTMIDTPTRSILSATA